MKSSAQWITYRTRFLVKAKQLRTNLSFVDPLGRQHTGRRGDYLVESSDGVISITPRQIFEDVYVPIPAGDETQIDSIAPTQIASTQPENSVLRTCEAARRKLPQPCRDRRGSAVRLGFM